MTTINRIWPRRSAHCQLATLLIIIGCQGLWAESWHITAGGQSQDKAVQALAFLPNEIWIHAGDSVTWTFPSNEPHSVTFLRAGQVRPNFQVGCAGTATTPDGSIFDGSTCVNSGLITTTGTTYTVSFPVAGNFTLVCLLHANMSGIIHVLAPSEALPHDQDFYDRQAAIQQRNLLSDHDSRFAPKFGQASRHEADASHEHSHMVLTGIGEIVSNTGGLQSASVMRFSQPNITIHAGETIEFSSSDVSGHSVTFGQEPPNVSPLTPPSASAGVVLLSDSDGALHAILNSPEDSVHSGRIAPAPQERTGVAQAPPGATRFRVTFLHSGTYAYICAFHDELGMKGEVTVLP
jgi:plastocyanin